MSVRWMATRAFMWGSRPSRGRRLLAAGSATTAVAAVATAVLVIGDGHHHPTPAVADTDVAAAVLTTTAPAQSATPASLIATPTRSAADRPPATSNSAAAGKVTTTAPSTKPSRSPSKRPKPGTTSVPPLRVPTSESSATLPATRTVSSYGSVYGFLRYTQKVTVQCPSPYRAVSGAGEITSPSGSGVAYLVGSYAAGVSHNTWVTEWSVPSEPMGPRKIRITAQCMLKSNTGAT